MHYFFLFRKLSWNVHWASSSDVRCVLGARVWSRSKIHCEIEEHGSNLSVVQSPLYKFWLKLGENSRRSTVPTWTFICISKNIFQFLCFMPHCWAIQASSARFPSYGHMLLTQMHHGIRSRPGATILLLLSKHGWAGAWTGVIQRKARLDVHPHAVLGWRFSHCTRAKVATAI